MAAYTKTPTWLAQQTALMTQVNNTTDREYMNKVLIIADAQFDSMESNLGAYTLSAATIAAVYEILASVTQTAISDAISKSADILFVEFLRVQAQGTGYTMLASSPVLAKQCMDVYPNLTHRVAMYRLVDLYKSELLLVEAADA
jgi:hypothetical protein